MVVVNRAARLGLLLVVLLPLTACQHTTTGTTMPGPPCRSAAVEPQDSTKGVYVALGDSYSSGEGAPLPEACAGADFLPGTESGGVAQTGSHGCHRSPEAWPVQVWSALKTDYQLSFHACSGAVTDDFYQPKGGEQAQRTWLSPMAPNPAVKLVTFTFGGNDAGFSTAIRTCLDPFGKCLAALAESGEMISVLSGSSGGHPGKNTLAGLYRDIKMAAPDARVVVVGYPQFFPDEPPRNGCGSGAGGHFTESDMLAVNQTATQLDGAIRAAAQSAGFDYVDISDVLQGHDLCASHDSWINHALPHEVQESFHPNIAGQAAIAHRVLKCIDSHQCAGGMDLSLFRVFGASRGAVRGQTDEDRLTITPPLGQDRYAALWGVYLPQNRCTVDVEFDVTPVDPHVSGNFGFAVAPRAGLVDDQPEGASIQYEHEAPPDFATMGSFIRPATLPEGAWGMEVRPQASNDIAGAHHVHVSATGTTLEIQIDGGPTTSFEETNKECGGVAIRVWGAAFTFAGIRVDDAG